MTSPPTSPDSKRGVRSYLREKYNKFIQSHSRSSSQQSIGASNSSAFLPSPLPNQGSTIGNFLAPPTASQETALRHARSDSHLSPSTNLKGQVQSKSVVWIGLRIALEELHKATMMFSPLESAMDSLISVLDLLEAASNNRPEYEAIAWELKTLSESLMRHMRDLSSARMSDCIANVALGIEEQAKMINKKHERGIGRRLMEARIDEDDIVNHYRKIEFLFRQLQTDANLSMWSIANEHLANTRLEGLLPAKMANYDSKLSTEISRRACTEGTRTAILSEMEDWSLDPNAPDLYLMSGMAGTGKTTIACSFSSRLEGRKQLAASFFCTRTSPECRDASRIIPTIAYQLARYSTPFQSALCEILGRDPDIGSKNIIKQFERLLKEPLVKIKDAIPENLVIVIDALDECDDRRSVRLVLDMLFKFAPGLPLKFFVTSRPEPEIYSKMFPQNPTARMILHLHEIEKSLVQADIELYLKEELGSISPTGREIAQLAMRSGNLFIYAATLVRYIQPSEGIVDPRRRLQSVLAITPDSTDKYAEIDALYAAVLIAALERKGLNSEEAEDVRVVLWTVLCVQEPINIETLTTLGGIDDTQRTLSALHPLRSVIHLSEMSGLVSTLHASFPDFMFSQTRSGPLFCNSTGHNQLLARKCFYVMKEQLRFNICDLESSFVPDAKVENLADRISKSISPTLSYACRYWVDHLGLSANTSDLSRTLEEFLSTRLLFWMEVLNLKHEMSLGLGVLVKAKQWLQLLALSPELVRLAEDALSFLTSYAANPVSQFTPHIYISSLPLCPRSSLVYKHYWPRARGLIALKGSGVDQREATALATWTIGPSVQSVAYSPDGSLVAFGCRDGTMGVRNAYDGSPIVGPWGAHTGVVWSIAFSPNGTRFTSGADDRTVKIWNVRDGTLVIDPLQGHTSRVKSVAFSPDGQLIASGAADDTVRVWGANDGSLIAGPLEGHTNLIWSVAFSPDSTRVASGSEDSTIRVWDIQAGTLVFDAIRGHTGGVTSVAFSPDGTRLVSGSADQAIKIWSTRNGALIIGPLEGHTSHIYSVAFSPDGTRLVSSSRDKTLQVWSSEDGNLVAGPLVGHTDVIWSTSFSPDGTRIVSCSFDGSIRVWNANAGKFASHQLKGHSDGIWSVAFSRNGTFIASGSSDSLYIWDPIHGVSLAGPFEGHSRVIRSVAISRDGTRLVSGSDDQTIRIWDVNKCTLIAGPFQDNDAVQSVEFSSDGSCVASGSANKTVSVWNPSNGERIAGPFEGHRDVVRSIAFSPDSTRIASGSYDRTIRVWDTYHGTLVIGPLLGHTSWVMSVAYSPCGQYVVSGSKDCTLRAWNTRDGTLVTDPFTGHTGVINSVAYAPDGTYVVSGSGDLSVRVWHAHSGTLVAGPFYGHTSAVSSAAFSFDGSRIVSGAWDSTIRFWNFSNIRGISSPPELPSTSPARSAKPPGEWMIKDNGWIKDHNDFPLFWAPPEIIRSLPTPHCSLIIGGFGTIEVDMSSALFGERWRECYI